MSGALSSISSGLSALSGLASLLGGGPAVQLDDFVFSGFEVPERMRWGGNQSGTMHKLIGGGRRVLDLTGPDDAPIEWSGVLLGADAKGRARELDALRQEGGPFNLDWAESSQRVWVRSCRFDEGFNQIRYDIVCEIIPEDDAPDDDLAAPSEVKDIKRQDQAGFSLRTAINDIRTFAAPVTDIAQQAIGVVAQVQSVGSALIGTAANVSSIAGLVGLHLNLGKVLGTAESILNTATGRVLGIAGAVNTISNSAASFGHVLNAAQAAAGSIGAMSNVSQAVTLLGGSVTYNGVTFHGDNLPQSPEQAAALVEAFNQK